MTKPTGPRAVTRDPLVQGGEPCLAGSRFTTITAWHRHEDGYAPEQIAAEYPPFTADDIRAAIAYEGSLRRRVGRLVGRWRCRAAGWLCEQCHDWSCGR